MAPLKLITLGSLRLTDANGREVEGPRRTELVLLAYLARQAPQAVPRESLASLFWGESEAARARQSLRQMLYRLRRHIGDALVVQRDHVQLVPGTVDIDLDLLEARIEAGELAAVADYTGEFLPWAEDLGGETWRTWVENERHALRHRLLSTLERLTGRAKTADDPGSVIRWAEQWTRLAPLESAPWIALVTGLERAERSTEARSRLEQAVRRFEEDIGAVPDELLRLAQLPPGSASSPSQAVPIAAPDGPRPPQRGRPVHRSAWVAGLSLLLLTPAALALRTEKVESESDELAPRLVVVALANRTGDPALNPLGRIAADWLSQGIARTNIATVVPPLLNVGPLEDDSSSHADRIRKLGADAAARLVVSGSYHITRDSIRFQVTVTDLTRDQILGTTTSRPAPISNPMPAIDDLQDRSLAALSPWLDVRVAGGAAVQSAPPSYESYRAFAQGLDFMYRSDARSVNEFLRAYQLDTTYTLPLLYAALTLTGMGDFTRVDSLVNQLQLRESELAPYDRHVLEYLAALMQGDHAGKYAAARQAARIAPRSLLGVVNLPGAALDINRPHEALAHLDRINPEHSAARGMRGHWLNLSMALHAVGRYQEQFELGRRVQRDMPEEPRALAYQVRGLAAQGRIDRLTTVLEEGLALPSTTQWRNYGLYLHWAAFDELTAHGFGSKAVPVLERGLRLTEEEWPADAPEPMPRLLRIVCLLRLGNLTEARAMLERMNEEDVPGKPGPVVIWGYLGMVGALQNDAGLVADADRRLAAVQIPPYIGYRGEHTMYRASIQALLGNRSAAVQLLHQAMREGYAVTAEFHTNWAFLKLRGYRPYDELLRPKG